jgi:hypothetical protein
LSREVWLLYLRVSLLKFFIIRFKKM